MAARARDRYTPLPGDRYGFGPHMAWRSWVVPTGIALIVASIGVASFFMLLPTVASSDAQVIAKGLDKLVKSESDDFLELDFGSSHILATLAFVGLIAVGLVILGYAREDRIAFMEAFPHVDLEFTPAERAEAVAHLKRGVVIAVIIWAVAVALFTVFKLLGWGHIATGCGFCVGAVGLWVLLHGGMEAKTADVFAYNFEAIKQTSYYELNAETKGADRDWVLQAKRRSMIAQTANRVILTAGALGSFALYALPTIATPYYWVAITVAGGIAMLNTHAAMEECRRQRNAVVNPTE